jgi:subtilisin
MSQIESSLENFGYARVLVLTKSTKSKGKSLAQPSKKIEEAFLSKMPEGAAMSTVENGKQEPYHYFPRLGLYVGYVNKKGLKECQQLGAAVHSEEFISPIRPVAKRIAMSAGDVTWGLERLGISEIWKSGLKGKGVRVGHLDTGVDARHESLRGRVKDFMETEFSGFIIEDNRLPEDKAHDSDDHGTHTAGTICGGFANSMEIGVAPECELFSGLVIEGGDVLVRVLRGMEWCLENEVRILSMSLGVRGFTPFWLDVTRALRQNNVLPVFGIGSEGPGTSRSPASYPEALSVGAMDSNDHVADFSSSIKFDRPIEPFQPDCVAPGVNVISPKPGGGVQAMDGTSMATPHVAGVAALLIGSDPDASVDDIEAAILKTCTPLNGVPSIRQGAGLVNPSSALNKLRNIH